MTRTHMVNSGFHDTINSACVLDTSGTYAILGGVVYIMGALVTTSQNPVLFTSKILIDTLDSSYVS